MTPGPALCAEARAAAQRLLDHYVQVQGAAVAQMLRKSVETRDWLGTVEPRNVRAVMKRVVEDITAIDVQVRLTPELRGLDTPGGVQRVCPRSLCGSMGILEGCGRVTKTLRDAVWFGGGPRRGLWVLRVWCHPQVGQLFEEGVRRAQSSDSSRRAFSVYSSSRAPGRYAPSYTPRSALPPLGHSGTPRLPVTLFTFPDSSNILPLS